jgi:hypothetical protein
MKKILLLLMLMNAFVLVKAQIVFNEFYPEPGTGNSEFIELYNQSGATENLDCYVALFYYESGPNKGFVVLDMPSRLIGSKKIGIAASAIPFNYQAGTYTSAGFDSSFNWSSLSGNSYLTQYQVNGGGYTTSAVVSTNDILRGLTGATKFQFFLFKGQPGGGVLVNGLSINGPESILANVRSCPDLTILDPDGAGPCDGFTIKWSQTTASTGATVGVPNNGIEYCNAAIGNDNGAYRLRDGQCGAWTKSSAQVNHTPGKLNGDPNDTNFQLTVQTFFSNCGTSLSEIFANFSISAGPASAFPVTQERLEQIAAEELAVLVAPEAK